MSKSQFNDVLSHWSKLFENFETPSLEFYASVKKALEQRQVPGLKLSRIVYDEGGVLAAQRTYLRVERERLVFDLCAAPFGTGFFFSWWFVERRIGRWLALLFIAFLLFGLLFVRTDGFHRFYWGHFIEPLPFRLPMVIILITPYVAAVVIAVLVTTLLARLARGRFEDAILGIPLVGPLYRTMFKPTTYYSIDTMLMFRASVHNAVLDAIDTLTMAKGLRALSGDERKPVSKEFFNK